MRYQIANSWSSNPPTLHVKYHLSDVGICVIALLHRKGLRFILCSQAHEPSNLRNFNMDIQHCHPWSWKTSQLKTPICLVGFADLHHPSFESFFPSGPWIKGRCAKSGMVHPLGRRAQKEERSRSLSKSLPYCDRFVKLLFFASVLHSHPP